MRSLKVYIADDHTLFRVGFGKIISDLKRVKVVKEASNGKELIELVREDVPDAVVLDLDMPVWDGTKTCKKLADEFPEVKIIIVSMHDSKINISYLLQLGAHAFLSKNAEPEELEAAIYNVVDKGVFRNKTMLEAIRANKGSAKISFAKNVKLEWSEREKQIIELLSTGLSNKEISTSLSLSENTIRNHKVRMMRRSGVKNMLELMQVAFQQGLIEKKF